MVIYLDVEVKKLWACKKVHFSAILIPAFGNVYFHYQELQRMYEKNITIKELELLSY